MGNLTSKQNQNFKGVFGKELQILNKICYSIINKDTSEFNKKEYNMFVNELNNNHLLILEQNLNKHLKVDLANLKSSLYFVPKNQPNVIEFKSKSGIFSEQNNFIKKSEMSSMIGNHYSSILNMVKTIVNVYDLEQGGDFSVAGIVQRNIKLENGLLVVNYCNMPHFDYKDNKRVDKVNFSNLKGIKLLTSMMSKDEANSFIKHMGLLLSETSSTSKLEESICKMDTQYKTNDFSKLYKSKKGISIDCSTKKHFSNTSELDFFLSVSKNNPILSSNKCLDKKKVIINMKDKNISKQSKQLYKLYDVFQSNYKININNVFTNLYDVIDIKKFIIKDISNLDLQNSMNNLKEHLIKFYINSLMDYKNLLMYSKKIGSVNVNKNNL
jgi:hypothetical protein|tara:strand:+ start:4269 stop:5417 length:1149 start_codon:yes stop_codon:yes gene_type:complete